MTLPEDQLRTVPLKDISSSMSCFLCKGYLVDCVAAEECGHVYCRSCIMRHISNGVMTCPQCHEFFNPEEHGQPFQKLRPDYAMQRLIYKLVPGLLSRETERRACYLNSEQEARTQIRQSTGKDALFFNERSCVAVRLQKRYSSRDSDSAESCGKLFLRTEMSTPLCVIGDYLRLRMRLNCKCKIVLSESASSSTPLPESFRLIELAYLTKWDKKAPLVVYYEALGEKSRTKSKSNKLSSLLLAAESHNPNEPSSDSNSNSSSSSSSPESSSGIKIKFNRNDTGRWRLAPKGLIMRHLHNSHPMKTISVQPRIKRDHMEGEDEDESRSQLLMNLTRDPVRIAKVLPVERAAASSSRMDIEDDFCKDPASCLLYNTGLAPASNSSDSGMF